MTGWLGGTFDPIHQGHLDVARAAQQALGLDRVWIGPTARPAHRATPVASPAHRFAMAALAIADAPGLALSDADMREGAPAYTWDLLDRLEEAGTRLEHLCVILGADAFRDIRSWRRYPAILHRCHFVVVSRPGLAASSMRAALPELADRMRNTPCAIPPQPGIFLVDMPTSPVASTDVRRALAAGTSLDGLVPQIVAAYIARQGLYRSAAVTPRAPQDNA